MCLACNVQMKSLKKEGIHHTPPWCKDVLSGEEFGKIVNARSRVHLHNHLTNKSIQLSQEAIKEITEKAWAVIIGGYNATTEILVIQWPNDYTPELKPYGQ